MLEIPEAVNLSRQLTQQIGGKRILKVVAAFSPHKFAWYQDNPDDYDAMLSDKTIDSVVAHGGMVEVRIEDMILLLSDGVYLKLHASGEKRPIKHQLLIEFDNGAAVSASVQMYGGLWCFKDGEFKNPYYDAAREKPSPLSNSFDWSYFGKLINSDGVQKLSAKAFLATEQRIPGLGNGVLQDILFNARIHPKRKIGTLNVDERRALFDSVKTTLEEMTAQGGGDRPLRSTGRIRAETGSRSCRQALLDMRRHYCEKALYGWLHLLL